MAAPKRVKTRFPGVYVRTSTESIRKHNGRPDRAFDICYKDSQGKLRWEKVGWLSEGVTEQYASNRRAEILASLKNEEKRLLTNTHQATQTGFSLTEFEQAPLFSSIAENYLAWLESESKYADRERFRYGTHLHDPLGKFPIDKITITEANTFKHSLISKMAIGTAKKCLNLCRAIYFHASINGLYKGLNPFSRQSGFKMPTGATQCERFLTPDEAKLILDELAKRSPQLRDMCFLSLHTGVRATEIFSIRGADLVPQAGFFWV